MSKKMADELADKQNTASQDLNKRFHYGHLIVIACAVFCGGPLALALSCAGLFFTPVAQSFGEGTGMTSYYITFIYLAAMLFSPLAGKIFDRVDSRIVTTGAVLIMAAAFFAQSFTTALWQYWACGFAMGLGVTILLFLAPSGLINRWFSKNTGGLIGVVMAFTGIGGVVWAPVVGSLINSFGWQAASQIAGLITLVCAIPFSLFIIRSHPSDKGLKPAGYREGNPKAEHLEEIDCGVEAKKAFRTRSFFFLALLGLVLNVCMYGYAMTASYISALSLSVALPLLAATVSSMAMLGQTIGKVVLGIIGDKSVLGSVYTALFLGILGMLGYIFLNNSEITLSIAALFYGVSYGLTNVILPIMTRSLFGLKNYVQIYARVSVFASFGSVIAAPLLGTTVDLTGGHVTMFAIIIGLFVLAMLVATAAMRNKSRIADM